MKFGFVILATALFLSGTAEYYSIMGLVAIFAAAAVPVIVMGASLGVGKIVATVWTHNNWKRIPWKFKTYLVPAITILMVLTSLGIFGFLSKAHVEQTTNTGNAQAQVQLFDEKIKTEKDNIDASRQALKQMDATVNLTMDRSTDAGSVQSAANIRKRQAIERAIIQKEISTAQATVAKLQAERAPLALESRKIEADIGPIKYIAALIYGDNPDANLLERAVRWVIILIVVVFDPLALCLILAANLQFEWARQGKGGYVHDEPEVPAAVNTDAPASPILTSKEVTPLTAGLGMPIIPNNFISPMPAETSWKTTTEPVPSNEESGEESMGSASNVTEEALAEVPPTSAETVKVTKVRRKRKQANVAPPVEGEIQEIEEPTEDIPEAIEVRPDELKEEATFPLINDLLNITDVNDVNEVTAQPKMIEVMTEFVDPNTRIKSLVRNWVPETEVSFAPVADNVPPTPKSDFGTVYPSNADKGDMFLRVDFLPAKLFKFNGAKWMEVSKTDNDSYAYNDTYVKFLIEKIDSGEYSFDDLTSVEQDQVTAFLGKK